MVGRGTGRGWGAIRAHLHLLKSLEAVRGCPRGRFRSGVLASCLSACKQGDGQRSGAIMSGEVLGAWRASSAFCGGINLPEGILERSTGSVASIAP